MNGENLYIKIEIIQSLITFSDLYL